MSGIQTLSLSGGYDTSPDVAARPYEHAEDLTPVPAVDLRHHDRFDCYPLPLHPPTAELVAAGERVTAELAAAVQRSRDAREFQPATCGAHGSGGVQCVRVEHPLWEAHEDWEGRTWFPGEAPR